MNAWKRITIGLVILAGFHFRANAADEMRSAEELKHLTLDDLLETKVISVSRTPEGWTTAPTAIDVLTQDEIRRSGATRLPETLRLAAGLNVARGPGSGYNISARGFNSGAVNKMEVLTDGRSLYTPLFSGVFWEIQDTLLEDIERIEVVRGPGATMWGANAINGVINILTKSSKDTQGTLLMGGGGTEERGFAGLRYGGKAGDYTYYRAYVKYQNRDAEIFPDGSSVHDGMQQGQFGFRTDSYLPGNNLLTIQGDLYRSEFGLNNRPDAENNGGNVLTRFTHDFSADSTIQAQFYYDRGIRDVPLQFREDRNTLDLQVQHNIRLGDRHNLVWGGDYRNSADETGTEGTFQFDPKRRHIALVSGFLQDEIAVVRDRLTLYLGSKFEHNDFSGFEIQPGARLAFTPTDHQTLWAAVSRGVRTPTRVDSDVRFSPNPASGLVLIRGNPDFESEELTAYELGYRVQPRKNLLIDLALFYNDYDRLRSLEPTLPFGIPIVPMNLREGETYGGEIAAKLQLTESWRIGASYRYLEEDLRLKKGSFDQTGGTFEVNDPKHMAIFHSAWDLPGNVEFDCFVRYVDQLPNPRIPSYVALDLRLAWYPMHDLELAIVGQNLLDDKHPEAAVGVPPAEVQRGVFAKATWRF